MRPLKIIIEKHDEYSINVNQIKYAFHTLMTIAGYSYHFLPFDTTETVVDIYFGVKSPENVNCKLYIKMAVGKSIRDNNNYLFKIKNGINFLLSESENDNNFLSSDINGHLTKIENDIIFSSFYLLSGLQERHIRRGKHDIHVVEDSFLFNDKLLHTPIINQYGQLIRSIFQQSHSFLPSWPGNKQYAVALSHDVDYPEMIRWIEAFRYLAKKGFDNKLEKFIDIMRGEESFWKFENWIEIEQNYDMKSAFYFCGYYGNLIQYFTKSPDPFYDVGTDKFKSIMRLIDNNGFEVGMHASYQTYLSPDQFREEKFIIEQSLAKPIYGNRHHYWHINHDNPGETAKIHNNIGLVYDSSIVFEQHSGFRYSICSPFHLFDRINNEELITLQLPPTLMDDHLDGYAIKHGFDTYQSHLDSLLDSVRKYEGVFVSDYHVRGMNINFFPIWKESYEYLLNEINKRDDFYCDTPIKIAKYWLNREQVILNRSIDER